MLYSRKINANKKELLEEYTENKIGGILIGNKESLRRRR